MSQMTTCTVQDACASGRLLAHQASTQVSCTHSDLNEPSRRLAFFPWISRSVSKCLWNTGNRWEVNEHLCSWVVESTAYEYELFDDIEFCSRITVLVVSAFISHLCYHAGETPVERTCNAVKFIILILFCWKGIYCMKKSVEYSVEKGSRVAVLESYSTKSFGRH
jgi:hypothetical protein